jgi:hypothetical protein
MLTVQKGIALLNNVKGGITDEDKKKIKELETCFYRASGYIEGAVEKNNIPYALEYSQKLGDDRMILQMALLAQRFTLWQDKCSFPRCFFVAMPNVPKQKPLERIMEIEKLFVYITTSKTFVYIHRSPFYATKFVYVARCSKALSEKDIETLLRSLSKETTLPTLDKRSIDSDTTRDDFFWIKLFTEQSMTEDASYEISAYDRDIEQLIANVQLNPLVEAKDSKLKRTIPYVVDADQLKKMPIASSSAKISEDLGFTSQVDEEFDSDMSSDLENMMESDVSLED